MRNTIFLYKEKTDDRDRFKYIDLPIFNFECGHYFSGLNVVGACFSSSIPKDLIIDNIETILSKEDFDRLIKADEEISNLKYGIVKGDEKYQQGLNIKNSILDIIEKLESQENENLYNTLVEIEKEELMNEYDLTIEEVNEIIENYPLADKYNDKSIIGHIDDNKEDLQELAYEYGYTTKDTDRYFNFESFVDDLLDGEEYYQLEDGRIIYYCM